MLTSSQAVGNGVAKEEIFAHFDKDYSGDVNPEEFREGLKNLGIFLTDAELLALMVRGDQSVLGVLNTNRGCCCVILLIFFSLHPFPPLPSQENFNDGHGGIAYQSFIDAVGLGDHRPSTSSNPMARDGQEEEQSSAARNPPQPAHTASLSDNDELEVRAPALLLLLLSKQVNTFSYSFSSLRSV
jgi:hypothetical protein